MSDPFDVSKAVQAFSEAWAAVKWNSAGPHQPDGWQPVEERTADRLIFGVNGSPWFIRRIDGDRYMIGSWTRTGECHETYQSVLPRDVVLALARIAGEGLP